MGRGEKVAGFRIEISPQVLKELQRLDRIVQKRIASRIEWLATNAQRITHHKLSGMPRHLKGLCKRREGDYRILYWPDFKRKVAKIYSVIHRREDYRSLK